MLILQNVPHSPVQQLQSSAVASHMPSLGPIIEHKRKQENGHSTTTGILYFVMQEFNDFMLS